MSLRDHMVGEAAVSYLPPRTSVSTAFISPTMVGNGAKLSKLLSLYAYASREPFVARI